jgi:hypothetical protein
MLGSIGLMPYTLLPLSTHTFSYVLESTMQPVNVLVSEREIGSNLFLNDFGGSIAQHK